MKIKHLFMFPMLFMATIAWVSCTKQNPPSGPEEGHNKEEKQEEVPVDISSIDIPEGALTAEEAVDKCYEAGAAGASGDFYIKGYIKTINATYTSVADGYITFTIGDQEFKNTRKVFTFFKGKCIDNTAFTCAKQAQVGDFVVVRCSRLYTYKGTPENDGTVYLHATTNERATPRAAVAINKQDSLGTFTYIAGNEETIFLDGNDGSLRLSEQGAGILSPVFKPIDELSVKLTYSKLVVRRKTEVEVPNFNKETKEDGTHILIEGLDATGAVIATERQKITDDSHALITEPDEVILAAKGIVRLRVSLESYPYTPTTDDMFSNVFLESVTAAEPCE